MKTVPDTSSHQKIPGTQADNHDATRDDHVASNHAVCLDASKQELVKFDGRDEWNANSMM